MMVRILALAISILAPLHASAASCFLSHEQCEVIAREQLMIDIQLRRDEAGLQFLPSYPRKLKLNELNRGYFMARAPRLPVAIGNEWARMLLCDSEVRLDALDGKSGTPKSCLSTKRR
jgi:hypothetical protein